MKKMLVTLMLTFISTSTWADFDEGIKAYETGDYKKALPEFRVAADQGNAPAQYNLGLMYHDGQGVSRSYIEAAKWFHLAAEQGYAPAQLTLGALYHDGQGVPQNFVESYKWFILAANAGNESAKKAMSLVGSELTPDQITEAQKAAKVWSEKHGH